MTQNPFLTIVESLLRGNNINFDKKELSFQIQSHPSYPSLHAITGVLDHFNIENIAASVEVNEETLKQLPETFMAQIQMDTGHELATIVRHESKFKAIISAKETLTLGVSEFLEKFTGVVVAVEKNEGTKQTESERWLKSVLWFVPSSLFLALYILSNPSLNSIIFFLLSIIGVVMSTAIVKQELGLNNTIGDAFCSSVNEKKDCDAVLTSNGAKIFGNYKVSDLSLVYFISLALVSLIFSIQKSNPNITYYLSLFALPITLYSIYYQWRVIKKWCSMCLSIVALLWLQAALSYLTIETVSLPTLSPLLIFSSITLSAFALWNYLRPQFEQFIKDKEIKIDFYRFKRNFELFSSMLNQSDLIDTTISDHQDIVVGNESSATIITIITSPFCGHCKPIHSLVEKTLKQHQQDVKITIRFNINSSDPDSEIVKITSRIIELYNLHGQEICLEAMADIYGDMKSDNWLTKWSETTDKQAYQKSLEEQRNWCTANQINFTPHILINGRAFPEAYDKQDLLFFIEDLNELEVPV